MVNNAGEIMDRAFLVVDSIAFEIVVAGQQVRILATDARNPQFKATYIERSGGLQSSASSFVDEARELALNAAVINNRDYLMEELRNAKILRL